MPQKSKDTPSLSSSEGFQRTTSLMKRKQGDFPGGPVVESPPCNAGDTDSIPGRGEEGNRTASILKAGHHLGPDCGL